MTAHDPTTPAPLDHRDVPGFPGYRVIDDGRVQSCLVPHGRHAGTLSDEWRDLKPRKKKQSEHLYVRLQRGGLQQKRYVHHLVLEAFVGPCPEGMECRHMDGDPGNNRLDNLAWGTHKQNGEDKVRHGTSSRGERNPFAKLTAADIRAIRRLRAAGVKTRQIAERFNVSDRHVRYVVRGDTWGHV